MSDFGIEERVRKVIAEVLELSPERVTSDTMLKEDLGADSMQLVTIVIALDDEFDTEFNTEDLPQGPVTIKWISAYVEGKICQET